MLNIVFAISGVGLIASYLFARFVLKADQGSDKKKEIALAIRQGAEAFLKRQYSAIGLISLLAVTAIFVIYFRSGDLSSALKTAGAFLAGAIASGIAGFIGMTMSVRANLRTAAATDKGVNAALQMALRGGAVSGILVVVLSLAGIAALFVLYGGLRHPTEVPLELVGFGFGASLVALFAQLGGGIYTKAADVGADLVGKVEAGIPEDDIRNPGVVADLVGDNVGDCAGRGADLFESTAAENIGAMILGIALFPIFGLGGILFPLVARAFGLVASLLGIISVKVKKNEDPMSALNRGYYVTAFVAALGFGLATYLLLGSYWLWFLGCGIIGILTAVAFLFMTQYYTEHKYRPVKFIVESSSTGAATNIISGFAMAMESTLMPAITISAALLGAYTLGRLSGINDGGLYGTAIATMGMLATAGYVLAMDNFGPVVDNAGGIIEMAQDSNDEAQKNIDRLDAVGNTTKALTKGYAVGSAALSAFLLFSAYLADAHLSVIDLVKPHVFVGGFLGAVLVFVFASLAIRAVGKGAYYIINEVRRQFKEHPEIMEGKTKPDYARCVDITTRGALKQMMLPGLLVVLAPAAVGIVFKAEAVGAMLMVATIVGVLLALILNNGGGAWDNAKKYIEAGYGGGKGTDLHKAAVVGDTVGDPFKDTAGPSLHVLIKLLATLTLVLLPLFL
jgi:K(+)-stimulated pyrophosphate-energized sodium pump